MDDMLTDEQQEIKNLRERLKNLANQKSSLQLVSDILTDFASVRGLENMMQKAIFTMMEAIGGSNRWWNRH